jgi:hypothetical protein
LTTLKAEAVMQETNRTAEAAIDVRIRVYDMQTSFLLFKPEQFRGGTVDVIKRFFKGKQTSF